MNPSKPLLLKDYRRVAFVSLLVLLTVAVAEFVAGRLTGSIGLVAGSYNTFSDVLSIVTVLAGLIISEKPPDFTHPYGHYKAENVASLFVGILIIVVGLEAIWESIQKFWLFERPEVNVASIATILFAAASYWLVAVYQRRVGERTGSPSLLAESKHFSADVYTALAPLAGQASIIYASTFLSLQYFEAVLEYFSGVLGLTASQWLLLKLWVEYTYHLYALVDPMVGIAVSFVVLATGYGVVKSSIDVLMEAVQYPEIVEEVRRIVEDHPKVSRLAQVRARGAGRYLLVDLTVELKPELSLEESHYVSEELKNAIRSRIPRVGYILIEAVPAREKEEIIVAFPVDDDRGLESKLSDHFGKCRKFLMVKVKGGKVAEWWSVDNPSLSVEHGKGPEAAEFLYRHGIDA
ncbi:MAG: cation diffusion facilitator family transporter, partial [Candidatus Freyarchaeota archaeon]